MTHIDDQPNNINPLSPLNFKFQLKRAPTLTYFCQSASIPAIQLGEASRETPFVKQPVPGDKMTYSPLSLRFQVDEDMKGWLEIHDWIKGLGFPDNFDQSIHRPFMGSLENLGVDEKPLSDGTLTIMTSKLNPNIRVSFVDMYPISLSVVTFDITQPDVTYLEADVDFAYRSYTVEPAT